MAIPFMELLPYLAPLVAGGHGIAMSVRFVKEGEEGIKLRFGKARRDKKGDPVVYKPGFAFLIPMVDKLVRRHVRVQTLDLPQQTITIKNGLSYIVDAVIRFRVHDIYKALFVVDDLDRTMMNVAMAELRDILTPYKDSEEMSDVAGMSEKLTQEISKHSGVWGVEIEQFSVVSCVPTPESQQIVNVAAGVKARVAALKEGFQALELSKDAIGVYPQLAAALIGIPVATAIGASPAASAQFVMSDAKDRKEARQAD